VALVPASAPAAATARHAHTTRRTCVVGNGFTFTYDVNWTSADRWVHVDNIKVQDASHDHLMRNLKGSLSFPSSSGPYLSGNVGPWSVANGIKWPRITFGYPSGNDGWKAAAAANPVRVHVELTAFTNAGTVTSTCSADVAVNL